MKKRIGSKLYDTDSSEFVADVGVGDIFRKKTRSREWFLLIGDNIEPLSDKEARALLGETVYIEKPVDEKRIMVGIYRETHDKICKVAKSENLKMADAVEKIVEIYNLRENGNG